MTPIYTYQVFFTETRGTGTYVRVQINIDGDSEPLIVGFDIPGLSDNQEAIDAAVTARVSQYVMERSGAVESTQSLTEAAGSGTIADLIPNIEAQINQSLESMGLVAVVSEVAP